MATKTRTPAAIPAESTAAHSTAYEPLMPLTSIHPHPNNPRHNAVADAELVSSIQEQGLIHDLVVAPHPEIPGEYRLIDGHRRLDGLTRAGHTYAPAKIRLDLVDEGDQLAAMLATIRREDLTPIEEAEGFDQLFDLGWNVEKIAAATGRSKTLVNARRRLTKLADKTKSAVDTGQVTIDDALAIAKFPTGEQTRLERYLGNADFKHEVRRTEDRLRRAAEEASKVKELKANGVPQRDKPKGVDNVHFLQHSEHGMVRLSLTGSSGQAAHDGCLAFVVAGTKQYPDTWLVCTDPSRHDEQLSAEQKQRQAERTAADAAREAELEEQRREAQERRRSQQIARQLRCDAVLAAIKQKPLDPILEALLRLALQDLVYQAEPDYPEIFCELAGVPEEQRWTTHHRMTETWRESILTLSGADLVKTFAAYCATSIERQVDTAADYPNDPDWAHDRKVASEYFEILSAAGHELNTVDSQLHTSIFSPEATS